MESGEQGHIDGPHITAVCIVLCIEPPPDTVPAPGKTCSRFNPPCLQGMVPLATQELTPDGPRGLHLSVADPPSKPREASQLNVAVSPQGVAAEPAGLGPNPASTRDLGRAVVGQAAGHGCEGITT